MSKNRVKAITQAPMYRLSHYGGFGESRASAPDDAYWITFAAPSVRYLSRGVVYSSIVAMIAPGLGWAGG
jgi:hypothetical protein